MPNGQEELQEKVKDSRDNYHIECSLDISMSSMNIYLLNSPSYPIITYGMYRCGLEVLCCCCVFCLAALRCFFKGKIVRKTKINVIQLLRQAKNQNAPRFLALSETRKARFCGPKRETFPVFDGPACEHGKDDNLKLKDEECSWMNHDLVDYEKFL